jgi:hypothetical protein
MVVIYVTTNRWVKGTVLSPELTRLQREVRIHVCVVYNFATEEPRNFPHTTLIFPRRIMINFAVLNTNLGDLSCKDDYAVSAVVTRWLITQNVGMRNGLYKTA